MQNQAWDKTPWERRPGNWKKIDELKKSYEDAEIPLSLIAETFDIHPTLIHKVADRLKFTPRIKRERHCAEKELAPTTLASIDAEEQELKRRLFELQQKRACMVVRVETYGKDFMIYGLTDEPFQTSRELIQNFLDGQGAGKLRDAVGRKS